MKRSLQRQSEKVDQTSISPADQVKFVESQFKPYDDTNRLDVSGKKIRLATFTNDGTIRVSEFGFFEAYVDTEGAVVVVLDPKSKANSRTFGRK